MKHQRPRADARGLWCLAIGTATAIGCPAFWWDLYFCWRRVGYMDPRV